MIEFGPSVRDPKSRPTRCAGFIFCGTPGWGWIIARLDAVCFPAEEGWQEPVDIYVTQTIGSFQLRVTASNCKSLEGISFEIGPTQDHKPVFKN